MDIYGRVQRKPSWYSKCNQMPVSSCAYHTVSPIYISTNNDIIVILIHIVIMGVPILKRAPFPRPRS